MAIDLNLSQVQKLRSAGVSPASIRSYQLGQLNPITGMSSYIESVLNQPGGAVSISSANPLRNPVAPTPGNSILSYKPKNPVVNNSNYGYSSTPLPPPPKVTYAGPKTPGAFGPGITNPGADADRQRNDEALDRRSAGRQAEIDQEALNRQPLPTAPALPVYAPLNLPDVVLRDFLDKAKQQYAAAYAPLYQALDVGKNNARSQQQTSDAVIQGLYAGLANDVTASGAQQAQQYRNSGNQATATAQALENKIGDIYSGNNADDAALAKSLGQEAAQASLIPVNAGERNFQQAEAATQGANQKQSYDQGAQAAQDYSTQTANAARTEGASRRSDLVSDLANVLSSYDQQALGYKSQEAQGAIQQSNVLSDRDLNQQEARIQQILSEAGINDSRTNATYSAQNQQYQDAVAQRAAQMAALQKQQDDYYKQLQDRIANSFKSREVATGEQNANTAAAKAAGAGGVDAYGNPTSGSSNGTEVKADPHQAVINQVNAATHGNPGASPDEYYAFVRGLQYGDTNDPNLPTAALGGAPDGTNVTRYDLNTFINTAVQKAQATGSKLNIDGIVAAATAYYNSLHN